MRNLFLRLRVILVSLFFIVLITGFLVFPDSVSQIADNIAAQEGTNRVLLAASAVLADVVLLVIIYLELGFGAKLPVGLVSRSNGGKMEIPPESLQSNLNSQLKALDDIYAVRSTVKAERGRAIIEMDVDADEKVNVRKKTKEIQRELNKIVDKQFGIRLSGKPAINLRLMSKPEEIWLPDTPTEAPENGILKNGQAKRTTAALPVQKPENDAYRPDTQPQNTTPRPGEMSLPSAKDDEDKFNW